MSVWPPMGRTSMGNTHWESKFRCFYKEKLLKNISMYLCLAAPCLSRCPWAFCHVEGGGYSPVALHGLLLQRLLLLWARASGVLASGFQHTGSVVAVHGLSCSTACGIFPDQGSNRCPLRWQGHSFPLDYSFEQCIWPDFKHGLSSHPKREE